MLYWISGMNVCLNRYKGFTLIEAMVTLLISILVLVTLQFAIGLCQHHMANDPEITWQTTLTQITAQNPGYQVVSHTHHSIELIKHHKKFCLKVANRKLLLSCYDGGQIILMHDIDELTVNKVKSRYHLTARCQEQNLEGELYFKRYNR